MKGKEKISKPSDPVSHYLRVVRLVPPDIELPNFWQVYKSDPKKKLIALKEQFGVSEDDSTEPEKLGPKERKRFELKIRHVQTLYQQELLAECLRTLPWEFIEYINLDPSLESTFRTYLDAYGSSHEGRQITFDYFTKNISALQEEFVDTTEGLKTLLEIEVEEAVGRYEWARIAHVQLYELLRIIELYRKSPGLRAPMPFRLRNFRMLNEAVAVVEDRLRFNRDPFKETFDGLLSTRLGRCANCRRVFWIGRRDMIGCTTRCSKVLRTRRWREKISLDKLAEEAHSGKKGRI